MRLNYFDFGVCYGRELSLMEETVLSSLNIKDYRLYGFEPCKECYDNLVKKYSGNSNISLINSAISDHNGKGFLYHSYKRRKYTPVGNSLFPSKYNVRKDDYEEVSCILFSEWLLENIPNYKNDFNIIRSNIEGAEWHLFNDLENNKLFDHIDIFCGANTEEELIKVKELQGYIPKLKKILDINKINVTTFIDVQDIYNLKIEICNKIKDKNNE